MDAVIHELKTWPVYFFSIYLGEKTFEVRRNDRNFKPGDILALKEFDPETEKYTGNEIEVFVSYVLHGGKFGIEEGFCVMSIMPVSQAIGLGLLKGVYCREQVEALAERERIIQMIPGYHENRLDRFPFEIIHNGEVHRIAGIEDGKPMYLRVEHAGDEE